MKKIFLGLCLLLISGVSQAQDLSHFSQVCSPQINSMCDGNVSKACYQKLLRLAHRMSREAILNFDGTDCSAYLRTQPSPRNEHASVCSQVQRTVIGALAGCWDQGYSRGCTNLVAQTYSSQLYEAGRNDPSCRARIEHACRAECYPRFPTDCNRSCAILAQQVP
jgi:hypothetical protein